MSNQNQPARAPLHGYQPLKVDESCLTDADCREAVTSAVTSPRCWQEHVTQQDWDALDEEIVEIEKQVELKRQSGIQCSGEYDIRTAHSALAQRATFRAFAREKYAQGKEVWLGDGPPAWEC